MAYISRSSSSRGRSAPRLSLRPVTRRAGLLVTCYHPRVRRNLDEMDARRLLTGGPVLLVTSTPRGRHNVLPVAYAMPLSVRPPLVGIALHPSRHSYDLIHKTETIPINNTTPPLL